MTHVQQNNETGTNLNMPYLIGAELRNSFGSDFKQVVMSTNDYGLTLSASDKNLSVVGRFMEPGVTDMFSLQMVSGTRNGLRDQSFILISRSTATRHKQVPASPLPISSCTRERAWPFVFWSNHLQASWQRRGTFRKAPAAAVILRYWFP
jgi:hypothetical protein